MDIIFKEVINMIEAGNIKIGGVFTYEDAIFVVLPFNERDEKYYNLCIAVRNPFQYDVGNEYYFADETMVKEISVKDLKSLLDI